MRKVILKRENIIKGFNFVKIEEGILDDNSLYTTNNQIIEVLDTDIITDINEFTKEFNNYKYKKR